MYPYYTDVRLSPHSSHHHPQFVRAPYPPEAPYALTVPRDQPSLSFDEMIKKMYADGDNKLRNTISRSSFPSPENRQQCLHFVEYLRIHRNLFMHVYVHLVSCCRGRYPHLQRLMDYANVWKGWGSVQQLTHHSLIKKTLLSFCTDCPCYQHGFLFERPLVISDDDRDLLCHLLYCVRKPGLYKLLNKPAIAGHDLSESEQVIELLWQFLMTCQENDIARRLRASIYRMARKSSYLPHDLQIPHPSLSNKRDLVPGANGLVTRARLTCQKVGSQGLMNHLDVVVKNIPCSDRASQTKCLEMFAGEAILWKTLQHKNIVPFLGVVMGGTKFDMGLVSPFFRNGNIRNHMRRYDPRDWPTLARRWAGDLAEGLKYIHCHEPPIVHGDIKGDNVLVDDSDRVLLGDFGQSYASDSGRYLDSTRVGLAAYNPVHWMAPELMEEGAKASDKSDIYSFGCVLYEMVSGKIPFEGLSMGYVVTCVTKGEHPSRPESLSRNDPLWKIAKLCWEKPPGTRPSAKHLVSLLR